MAWAMQLAAAFLTAPLVTVAPVTPSISAAWAFFSCSASVSAAAAPISGVSPLESTTTSTMLVSSKVIVTVTMLSSPCSLAL